MPLGVLARSGEDRDFGLFPELSLRSASSERDTGPADDRGAPP
jgi:hypothetical protein